MCDPVTIAVVATGAAGAYKAYSQVQEGKASKNYYNYLADQNEQQGAYALKTGQRQSESIQEQAKAEGKQLSKDQARFSSSQVAQLA